MEDQLEEIYEFTRFGETSELIEFMNDKPKELLFQPFNYGNTSIHLSSANGHLETLQYLISVCPEPREWVINRVNEQGNTALHWAALNGHVAVIELLLKSGADPLLKNEQGHTALYNAQMNGKQDAELILLKLGNFDVEDDEDTEEEENTIPEIEVEYVQDAAR